MFLIWMGFLANFTKFNYDEYHILFTWFLVNLLNKFVLLPDYYLIYYLTLFKIYLLKQSVLDILFLLLYIFLCVFVNFTKTSKCLKH